jgi:S1-C subfamily serine protease
VVLMTVDEFAIMRFDLAVSEGVLITQVVPGSPADQAGLAPGDVITGFEGKEIATTEQLIRAIHTAEVGQKVEITFWRGETENITEVILAESPPP